MTTLAHPSGPWVIRGALLVDPSTRLNRVADLRIAGDRIDAIDDRVEGLVGIDGRGLVVVPGFCDAHVHLREPGQEAKETIDSGTRAAAAGGVTAVACMPNTSPSIDSVEVVRRVLSVPAHVRVFPIGAMTVGRAGVELTDYRALKEAGVVALSDDGRGVQSAGVMRRVFEAARDLDLALIQHCEDEALAAGGAMHEGRVSAEVGVKGIPWTAEATMIARDLLLLEHLGGRLHVAHVSCRQSIELVRLAKQRELPVTAEACPHHFVLTDEAVRGVDPQTKVNPPLREEADREAVLEAVADGTIDVVASDHAPHTAEEKRLDYAAAPFGISGIETLFALSYSHLVQPGSLALGGLVERLCHAPRRLLGLEPVRLAVGSPADLAIVDLAGEETIDRTRFASLGKNTPFHGMRVRGTVVHTVVGGRVVHSRRR